MDSNTSLPYNEDAEQSFLGVLLNNASIFSGLDNKPGEVDFYFERHRLLFSAIVQLWDTGNPVDIVSVSDFLTSENKLRLAGGSSYISSLVEKGIIGESAIGYYAQIIIQKSQRRRLIQFSGEMLGWAQDESKEILGVIEECEKSIFDVTDRIQSKMYHNVEHYLSEFYSVVQRRSEEPQGTYSGIETKFPKLDKFLSGLQNGELIILGARPSVGKTAFSLNMVQNIAFDQSIPVGYFSMEMQGREIVSRIICQLTNIDNEKIRQNMLSDIELQRIQKVVIKYSGANLFISDIKSLSLFDLKVQSRRLVHKEGVKVIFIDYLGLLNYYHRFNDDGNMRYTLPKHEQFAEISRSLKVLAGELDIPIVALSQLNREGEGKNPSLANIRESGAIEQDADVVLFLHKADENNPSLIKLIIAKQRNGPTGSVMYNFTNFTFKELASDTLMKAVEQIDNRRRTENF